MPHHLRTDSQTDPLLCERRRAQRRLIGALVLVLAAVITLPILLDSQPQPAAHNITIEVPKSLFETCKQRAIQAQGDPTSPLSDQTALDALCDDSESRFAHISNLGPAPTPLHANQRTGNGHTMVLLNTGPTKPNPVTPVQPAPAPIRSASPAPQSPAVSSRAPAVQAPTSKKAQSALPQSPSQQTSAPNARFFIHIGNFSSKAQAEMWMQKLQKAGFAASIESPKSPSTGQSAKSNAFALSIGPFNDKAHAQRILERIEKLGLNKGKK